MSNKVDREQDEFEERREAFERVLLHPHLEGELEWLRIMQDTTIEAGLNQIVFRKYCIAFNLLSAALALKITLWDGPDSELNFFWVASFAFANLATLGFYFGVALSVASHKSILSRINEGAREIDATLNGDTAVGSAIDARIW